MENAPWSLAGQRKPARQRVHPEGRGLGRTLAPTPPPATRRAPTRPAVYTPAARCPVAVAQRLPEELLSAGGSCRPLPTALFRVGSEAERQQKMAERARRRPKAGL